MGLFSRGKCPIHGIEYSLGKDYMCQPYLYCKKCRAEKYNIKRLNDRIEKLESLINKQED